MPDWSWTPLVQPVLRRRPPGTRRPVVLSAAARLVELPGGPALVRLLTGTPTPAAVAALGTTFRTPFGIASGVDPTGEATGAFAPLARPSSRWDLEKRPAQARC